MTENKFNSLIIAKPSLNHFIIHCPTPSTMILNNKAVVDVTERERNGLISL